MTLIQNAEIWRGPRADVRLSGGRIVEIGMIAPVEGETVIDARGGALLPGLHDHHIHLAALAAKAASVSCGPPHVKDRAALAAALQRSGTGWLRGIGYHESVVGMLDAVMLDHMVPDRPVRIQHRSGRMWFFNSMAIDLLLSGTDAPPGLDGATGQLFDSDDWLRTTLASAPPDFRDVSAQLAAYGITGLTDMSPANDTATVAHFRNQQAAGHLLQKCVLAGTLALADATFDDRLTLGPAKIHLHDAALPDPDETVDFVRSAHAERRPIAAHCTTEGELVFTLAALRDAGAVSGDRIEHAGIAPDHLVADIAELGLWVCSQPHFIAERGDQYARDVDARDVPTLYRLRAFIDAGVPLAAGSDAPFGAPDPCASMVAAVLRTTRNGLVLGPDEALTRDAALSLFLADPRDLTRERRIEVGAPADLCLLDRPWAAATLSADEVRVTIIDGDIVYNRIDETPVECCPRVDAAA